MPCFKLVLGARWCIQWTAEDWYHSKNFIPLTKLTTMNIVNELSEVQAENDGKCDSNDGKCDSKCKNGDVRGMILVRGMIVIISRGLLLAIDFHCCTDQ